MRIVAEFREGGFLQQPGGKSGGILGFASCLAERFEGAFAVVPKSARGGQAVQGPQRVGIGVGGQLEIALCQGEVFGFKPVVASFHGFDEDAS